MQGIIGVDFPDHVTAGNQGRRQCRLTLESSASGTMTAGNEDPGWETGQAEP